MASQTQKRSASEQLNLLENVKAVLLDIEGTTTPLSFVHDKLFGYVRDNVKAYLAERWENEEVQADIEALREQATTDKEVEGCVEVAAKEEEQEKAVQSVVDNVLWQMNNDRRPASLKQLQGHMWRDAYKTGKVQGEVFDDVVDALKAFKAADRKVYIYSNAGVDNQKLLFGYSEKGDLSEFVAGNFDTTVGPKTEKDSYDAIAKVACVAASEMLFVTDLPKEAAAAAEAGLNVAIIVRDGNTALTEEESAKYTVIASLSEVSAPDAADEPPAKKSAPEVVAEESNGAAGEEEDEDLDDDELGEVDDDDVVDGEEAAAEEAE